MEANVGCATRVPVDGRRGGSGGGGGGGGGTKNTAEDVPFPVNAAPVYKPYQ